MISPDDRLRFLARIQWSTRILASNLSRIVVCWDASVAPAYCINVDFPIPVAYWLSVESVDYKNHVNISSFHFVCEKVKELLCSNMLLTRLLRHITGQNEHPNVQQQQMQPHNSHLMLRKWKKIYSKFGSFGWKCN